MVRPIGVGGLPKKTSYFKPANRRKRDDSIAASVTEGQKVYHKDYGSGVVESVDEYSASAKVRFNKDKDSLHIFSIPGDFLNGVLK